MAEIICNVCREPITVPAEQVDHDYKIKATGMQLPHQKTGLDGESSSADLPESPKNWKVIECIGIPVRIGL